MTSLIITEITSTILILLFFENSNCQTYIDLSYSIGNKTVLWPTHRRYQRLRESESRDVNGQWLASFSITISEHTSTHMDSPYHVYPSSWKLSEIPTDRLYDVPAVMIDVSRKILRLTGQLVNYGVTKEDIMEWERYNGPVPPCSLVLIRTGWGDKISNPEIFLGTTKTNNKSLNFPSVGLSAAKYLAIERGVYGVGVDAVSIDVGNSKTFPTHSFLGSRNVYIVENAANLQTLPPRGFRTFVFPIRIDTGTGSPIRMFAVLNG